MAVVNTYEWLIEEYESPEAICNHFTEHIPIPAADIYAFLSSRGMYRPSRADKEEVKRLAEQRIWRVLQNEFIQLRKWLKGPNVPIYILPSDLSNRFLIREYNGKAGLALPTCIFIFASSLNTRDELKAMLTHEYHHVCRLHALTIKEKDCTLLDSMIMEGLAEVAVAERHGISWNAPWVSFYTREESIVFWMKYIKDQISVKKNSRLHDVLLNGMKGYPRMLGYCIGYHIVKDCTERENLSSQSLLHVDANQILQYAKSFAITNV